MPNRWVTQLFETSDHQLWAATVRGLAQFFPAAGAQGRRVRAVTTWSGLTQPHISALNEDRGGNLWLGTTAAVPRDAVASHHSRR